MIIQYFWASYTQIETVPYSQFEQLLNEDKIAEVTVAARFDPGHLEGALAGRQADLLRGPRGSRHRGQARGPRGDRQGRGERRHRRDGAVLDHSGRALLSDLDDAVPAHGGPARARRTDGDRQVPRQGLCRDQYESDVQGRGRGGGGEVRAARGGLVPAGSQGLWTAGGAHPQGHPPGRAARNRQDTAGARRGGRGERAVLLDLGLRIRRDVRRGRCGPRPRPVRAGAQIGSLHHLHR